MSAVESWCRDSPVAAAKALKLGPKSIDELANNVFRDADLMPAIERYTGVLYSATNVSRWTPEQRDWAATRQVAALSGYASDSAFCAMFKAAMGQSPSRFQRASGLQASAA